MESTKNLTKTLELTMYQIDKTPFYLEKNAVKQDVLHGNIQNIIILI